MSDVTKTIIEGKTYIEAQVQTIIDKFWEDSRFTWFRILPSRSKGAKGEGMVADMLENLGCNLYRNKKGKPTKPKGSGTDFDIYPDQIRTEVKTSSSWDAILNRYKWQQLRSLQEYDRVVLLGINPNQAQAWWCTKEDLEKHIFGRDEFRQHGGKKGAQELYWISTPGGETAEVPAFFRSMDTWND